MYIIYIMQLMYVHYASIHFPFFSRRDRLHEETKRKDRLHEETRRKVLVFFFFWRGKSSWINHGHIDIDTNFWSNRIKLYSRFEVFAFILSIYDLLLISHVLPLRFSVLSAISRNVESIFETIWILKHLNLFLDWINRNFKFSMSGILLIRRSAKPGL
jgi:hypothetical protein